MSSAWLTIHFFIDTTKKSQQLRECLKMDVFWAKVGVVKIFHALRAQFYPVHPFTGTSSYATAETLYVCIAMPLDHNFSFSVVVVRSWTMHFSSKAKHAISLTLGSIYFKIQLTQISWNRQYVRVFSDPVTYFKHVLRYSEKFWEKLWQYWTFMTRKIKKVSVTES